jgi:hypothetical protein
MSKGTKKKYLFSLINVNIGKVDQKYGLICASPDEEVVIPANTTKIDDLDIIKKTPDVISFLDESKRLRKCSVSTIVMNQNKKYKCYWDKHDIPEGVQPIGCPIKYIPSKVTKTYNSEISKEKYSISEVITDKRRKELEKKGDTRFVTDKRGLYETDGVFCSFNCVMAWILDPENKRDPLYKYSLTLLLQMYNDLNPEEKIMEIMPSPHWRLLEGFGGNLSIEKYRESFNKILYVYHGLITCVSVGRLYEDNIKF